MNGLVVIAALLLGVVLDDFNPPPIAGSARQDCVEDCSNCPRNPLPVLTEKPRSDPLRVNVDEPVVLILYRAEWCGPCHSQFAMLSRLRGEGYPIRSIDVDDPKFARFLKRQPYTVLPHYLMVRDGRTWQVRRGSIDESTVRRWFAKAGFLPPQKAIQYTTAPAEYFQPMPRYQAPTRMAGGCGNPGCQMCYGGGW